MTHNRRRSLALVGLSVVTAMGLSACLQNPNAGGGGGQGEGGSGFVTNAQPDGDKKVTILGAFGGAEQEAFEASLEEFQQESGITIEYTADQDFTTTIKQKAGSGDAPDIGLFPQPGGLLEQAAQGRIQPIDSVLDYDALNSTLIPGFLDAARYKGRVYGAPMRMAVKSIVWYPKKNYDAAGYSTDPSTIQELATVTDKIKADGIAPWCMTWNSDQATGWVGTDWIEEYVLRMYGPDVYDQWTSHQIPFNDDRIVAAFDEFGKIAKVDGQVFGGVKTILNTGFADAMVPSFKTPPQCLLMRQGNFAISFFPENITSDLDNEIGIFTFPKFEGGYDGQPILGGGDLAAQFNGDDADTTAVMKFLTSDEFGGPWAKVGGWLSPHKTFDAANYPNDVTKKIADLAANAAVFRYDGSDLMPAEVGSGSFWTGMVEWVQGTKTSEQAATDIENSWPK